MADVGNHADNDEITELDVDESNAGSVATAEAAKKKKKKKKNPATNSSDTRLFGFTFSPTRFQMVRVRFLEGKGRCLETSRKLPAGTPFFREKAICSIAHDKQLCALCSCFISDATASCGDDMLPFDSFCSQRCLQQSLDLFQLEFAAQSQLQLIAQSYSCSLDLVRMVCRIICTRANQVLKQVPGSRLEAPDADIVDDVAHLSLDTAKSDAIAISAATASFLSDNGDFITATFSGLQTLEDHMSDQAPSWRDAITSAMSELLKHLPESVRSLFTVEHAVSIAGRINVNAYGIVVDVPVPPAATLHRVSEASTAAATTRRVAAGFGLFPAVGLCVNHACRPNSVFSFGTAVDVDGSPLSVMDYRTITEVAAAAELTVSYIDIFQGRCVKSAFCDPSSVFIMKKLNIDTLTKLPQQIANVPDLLRIERHHPASDIEVE